MIDVSVIIPVYRNAPTLAELSQRLITALAPTGLSFEILFVDDHSPDHAALELRSLAANDPRIAAIRLASNVGQNRAVLVGLQWRRGRLVAILDADLQDPPEALPALLQKITPRQPVVFAGRRGEYQSSKRLFTSRLFKTSLQLLYGIPSDAGSYVVITADVADKLLTLYAPAPYILGMLGSLGVPLITIPVARATRPQGESTYTSWMRLKIGINAIFWVFIWKCQRLLISHKPNNPPATIRELIGKRFHSEEENEYAQEYRPNR